MAWYRAGTVGVTNGSTTVALSGGNALANIFPGDSFLGPDGRAYEVALVTSATSFALATAYQGATATGQPYAIQPTGSTGALRLLNDQVSDLVTNYQAGRDAWASAPASTLKGRKSSGAGAVENLTPVDVLTLLSGGTSGALTGAERLPALQGASAVGLTINQLLSRAAGQVIPFDIGGGRVATISANGIGVGTGAPTYNLHALGTGTISIAATTDTSGTARLLLGDNLGPGMGAVIYDNAADELSLHSAGVARIRVPLNGTILIGKSAEDANSVGIEFTQTGIIRSTRQGTSFVANRLNDNGTALEFRRDGATVGSVSVTTSSTSFNTTSDYRVKLNLEPLTGALDRIDSIPVYRGNFTADPDAPKVDMFLAHEAQAGVPEAVTGGKDAVEEIGNATGYRDHDLETGVPILASKETLTGITQAEAPEGYVWTKTGERPVYQGIDQSKLVPLHHAGIQELRAEIRSLKARLDALEAAA